MTDQFQAAPDGAHVWRPAPGGRYVPKENPHKAGDPIVGVSGALRVRLDRASYYLPPEQRVTRSNGLSHGEQTVAAGQDGVEPVVLPNGGSLHIAEAGFRAATPIGANNFAEIQIFDGLNPVEIPGADGGTE